MASRERGAPIFSEYYEKLEGPEKKRYKEKVYLCVVDPYTLKRSDFEDSVALFPGILCFHVTSSFSKTKNYESFCSSSFIRCKTL